MTGRVRHAIAVALLGCGGTTAVLGDPPAGDASAATCAAFEPGKAVCDAKLGPAPDARAAETAQATSELWRMTRQATLQIAWSCSAIATMNPMPPLPTKETPTPTGAEVEQACAAAKATLRGVAPRVVVTFHTVAGSCASPLCPGQGAAQCRDSQSTVEVVPAGGAEVTMVERAVLLAALPALDEALTSPILDLSARATSTLAAVTQSWELPCATAVSQTLRDATALYGQCASAGVGVRELLVR